MDYENRFAHTEMIIRDLNADSHYRTMNPQKLEFRRGTIICLSGSGTTDLKAANGFAKIAQINLDLMFKTQDGKNALDYVDILSVKYARTGKNPGNGYMTDNFCDQLTDAMIKLLVDKNGQRLPLDQAKQNFSRITFFTYCHGNLCMNDIINSLNQKLIKLGYTNEEAIAINNASFEVSFAGPNPAENRIPSVRVLSLNDPVVSSDLQYLKNTESQIKDLDGFAIHKDAAGYLYGKSRASATAPSLQVISSNLLDIDHGFHLIFNDHNIRCVSFNKNWELNPCEIDHQTIVFKNAQCAAESIALATCFGVKHSLNNLHAEVYQPQPWHELIDDLQYNIDSYAPKKLSQLNPSFIKQKPATTQEQ